jgi:predicted nucleotidyltransferase
MNKQTSLPKKYQVFLAKVCHYIKAHEQIDALYLYGSRAKGTANKKSDWDIAILFKKYIKNPLERHLRPQLLQQDLEQALQTQVPFSIVDLEIVDPRLQWAIINGIRFYDSGDMHVRRIENSICSKIEKDYDYKP